MHDAAQYTKRFLNKAVYNPIPSRLRCLGRSHSAVQETMKQTFKPTNFFTCETFRSMGKTERISEALLVRFYHEPSDDFGW